ncbi:hypothetical protein ABZT48_37950 [Streptomyces avermitilis]|uniref:hypothetical protein n=1 Tax=Streptomyces avermitilis TaxID=33903 RepID=UPI0033AF9639
MLLAPAIPLGYPVLRSANGEPRRRVDIEAEQRLDTLARFMVHRPVARDAADRATAWYVTGVGR